MRVNCRLDESVLEKATVRVDRAGVIANKQQHLKKMCDVLWKRTENMWNRTKARTNAEREKIKRVPLLPP